MTYTLQRVKVAIFLIVFLTIPVFASAQNQLSLSVSPTIFDMTANPGQTWQSTVRIINANPYELTLYVDVANFIPKGETGVPQFIPLSESPDDKSLAKFVSVQPSIVIPPEKTVEFPFTIALPPDMAPGGHFAALMVSTKPTASTSQASVVQTSQVITSLIFLRVSGDVVETSTIRSFRTTDFLLSKPEATFELRIENKGNVHVQPRGEIAIYNMWGQERGVIDVNQQTLFGNVLPNSVRKYSFTWSGEWSPTDIGRYTAVATLGYGLEKKQFMYADTAFWIIPWKFLLIIFVVVGGFISLMSWAIKLYIRRVLTLAGVEPAKRTVNQYGKQGDTLLKEPVTIPLVKGAKTRKQKIATVVAPLEEGILDLRARLRMSDSLKLRLLVLVGFAKQYWKFFVAVLAIIIFLILVTWFISEANAPERDFEILIEGDGHSVKISSDDVAPVVAPSVTPPTGQNFTLSVLNRSGDASLSTKVSKLLTQNGFITSDISEGQGGTEERTVIVYDPRVAESALKLSKVLDNALLSSFTDASTSTPQIMIYLGSETIQKIK